MTKPAKGKSRTQDTKPKGAAPVGTAGQSGSVDAAPPVLLDDKPGASHFADAPESADQRETTLYLKVDGNGTPLWSRMTPATIDKWKSIFGHPATSSQFNQTALPPENPGAQTADADMLIGWLGMGQAMLYSRMLGLSVEDAGEICAYTAGEREQLSPRLARLMNKWGGDWLAKYGDEIFFVSALSMGMAKRFQACAEKAAALKRKAKPAVIDADAVFEAGKANGGAAATTAAAVTQ